MYKPRRAKASFTKRYAHAELSTSNRELYAMMKLYEDGTFIIEFHSKNGKVYRRELTPTLNYQD